MDTISKDAMTTVQQILNALSYTVATREYDKHMELYSRHVQVFGVPGREILDYQDVAIRRRTEFSKGLLMRLSFKEPEIVEKGEHNVTYHVHEIMRASNRSALVLEKKVTITLEYDGKWRIREEHILHAETRQPSSTHDQEP